MKKISKNERGDSRSLPTTRFGRSNAKRANLMPNQPSEKVNLGSGLTIKFAGQKVTITTIAFFLMLGGILLPTAKYAFALREPTPAQLLVAVCMAMFSAVLFLWILDATEILPFRAAWVSKSVYGAAIVSVLGTSVAVYRDA